MQKKKVKASIIVEISNDNYQCNYNMNSIMQEFRLSFQYLNKNGLI